MDIRKALIEDRSKSNIDRISGILIKKPELFDQLVTLTLSREKVVAARASWLFSNVLEKEPKLLNPYLPQVINHLKRNIDDSVKRNLLRALQFCNIPENHWGELYDIGYKILTTRKNPVAIKVFSMTVLYHIVLKVPELKNELRIAIEDEFPLSSAGFKSRGRKILKSLDG